MENLFKKVSKLYFRSRTILLAYSVAIIGGLIENFDYFAYLFQDHSGLVFVGLSVIMILLRLDTTKAVKEKMEE